MSRRSAGAILLARTGKTQDEIASRLTACGLRVSRQMVGYWMSGDKRPRVERRALLETEFGVPASSWDEAPRESDPIRPRSRKPEETESREVPSGVLSKAVALERICDELWAGLTAETSTPAERADVGKTIADVLYKLARLPTSRLTQHPDWPLVRRAVREALRGHPDAARALEEHMQAIEDSSAA